MSHVDGFKHLLSRATAEIPEEYIHLPEAGREERRYREQVYCYELYHQLRSLWSEFSEPPSLSGELDKQGHKFYPNSKPDLLVHGPGNMENNIAIVEVKPATRISGDAGFKNDLEKLTEFQEDGYECSIHLTYSRKTIDGDEILDEAHTIAEESGEVDLDMIEFWGHGPPGSSASRLDDPEVPAHPTDAFHP